MPLDRGSFLATGATLAVAVTGGCTGCVPSPTALAGCAAGSLDAVGYWTRLPISGDPWESTVTDETA